MARQSKRTSRKQPRRARGNGKQFASQVAAEAASVGTAEDRLAEAVRAGVARALREPREVAGQVFDTVVKKTQEAMMAAKSAGGDALVSARSVTRGVLLGVSDARGDVVASAGHAVRAAISSAADAGNEAVAIGQRALQGAVDAAKRAGADPTSTAREAVDSVSDIVLSAGESAGALIDRLLKRAESIRTKVRPMQATAGRKTRTATKRRSNGARGRKRAK
jgi:hypothetical protein